jgi:cyanophycinase
MIADNGHLVLVGGGIRTRPDGPRPILRRLACEAVSGRPHRSVLLVPTASAEPEHAVVAYTSAFMSMGVDAVDALDVRSRVDAERLTELDHERLRAADLIFLTGGDQQRLAEILRETQVHDALRAALAQGKTVAGTSAGAVALAEVMHFAARHHDEAQRADAVETGPGLGLLRGAFVDTHFTERQRLARLFMLVTNAPARLGLGLDEDTAAVVHGSQLTVLGRGALTIVDGYPLVEDRRAGVHLHVLRSGDRYDMQTRVPTFGPLGHSDASAGAVIGRRERRSTC